MKHLILVLFLLTTSLLPAQTIIIDDFNGNNLSTNWLAEGTTFLLNETAGELQIDYNRDANSGQWDQFNVSFTDLDLMQYNIKLDIRSDVAFELTLKPVYTDNSNDWLQTNISSDNTITTITLQAEQTSIKTLNKLYFYFDGGSSDVKSGTVYIDNISVEKAAVFTKLNSAIDFAQLLHDNSAEGTEAGQYEDGAKSAYNTAINAAKSVSGNTSSSQEEINQALEALNDATYAFEISGNIDANVSNLSFADPSATIETKNLYYNLKELSATKILFGMQDATGYGVGWSNDNDRSDVKDVCGSYPAVCAWSIKEIAKGSSYYDEIYRMSKIFNLGGINTIEWHMDNPYGGGFYYDDHPDKTKNVVASILPGGEHHDYFKSKLDNIAFFARNLKGEKGQSIPVIFRPFHEHNGSWFWWGQPHCTPEEYKQLWIFTVDYLKSKKVNNFLYAYSPDRFVTQSNYLECYPGDEYVDILGFDDYWDLRYYEGLNLSGFVRQLGILTDLAENKNKVAALTECGYEGVRYDKWFTEVLLNPIKDDAKAKRIAYVAVWRNANETHHYAPYPGHSSSTDFVNFYNDETTVFIDNIEDMYSEAIDNSQTTSFERFDKVSITTKVYPNPSSHSISVSSSELIKSVHIYQLNGTIVFEKNNINTKNTELNLLGLNEGVFILKINTEKGLSQINKITISR